MNKKDGKDKNDKSPRRRVGVPAILSEVNGITRQRGASAENSEGRDSTRTITVRAKQPDGDLGKILERLEVIEQAFYGYVHAHQNRLEARLEESKILESTFSQEVQSLKEQVLRMAEAEQSNELKPELEQTKNMQ